MLGNNKTESDWTKRRFSQNKKVVERVKTGKKKKKKLKEKRENSFEVRIPSRRKENNCMRTGFLYLNTLLKTKSSLLTFSAETST